MLTSDFRKPTVPSAEHRTRFIFTSKILVKMYYKYYDSYTYDSYKCCKKNV